MRIDSKYFLENFHLYCKDSFYLSKDFHMSLLSEDPNRVYSFIGNSLESNKAISSVSNRFLELRFIELLGGEILSPMSSIDAVKPTFRVELLKRGLYEDLSVFDSIVLNKSCDPLLREYSVSYCSVESLKKLFFDKSQKIRESAFDRVGPKDSLKYMVKDPSFVIRKKAAQMSSYNSDEAFRLANDKSKKVIAEAINKISIDKVLFLLGNKKIQNDKVLLEILKDRLSGYV